MPKCQTLSYLENEVKGISLQGCAGHAELKMLILALWLNSKYFICLANFS